MYNITQRGLFPTDVYHLDIYDEKENKKYKDFLIDLASKDEGKNVVIEEDINPILYCGKKKYLNHS